MGWHLSKTRQRGKRIPHFLRKFGKRKNIRVASAKRGSIDSKVNEETMGLMSEMKDLCARQSRSQREVHKSRTGVNLQKIWKKKVGKDMHRKIGMWENVKNHKQGPARTEWGECEEK